MCRTILPALIDGAFVLVGGLIAALTAFITTRINIRASKKNELASYARTKREMLYLTSTKMIQVWRSCRSRETLFHFFDNFMSEIQIFASSRVKDLFYEIHNAFEGGGDPSEGDEAYKFVEKIDILCNKLIDAMRSDLISPEA